jgi:hypothetical protein
MSKPRKETEAPAPTASQEAAGETIDRLRQAENALTDARIAYELVRNFGTPCGAYTAIAKRKDGHEIWTTADQAISRVRDAVHEQVNLAEAERNAAFREVCRLIEKV